MPIILASAALLVVLTRPEPASPPPQAPAQAEPAAKTKKKDKEDEQDAKAPKAPKEPKEQKPEFRFENHPSLHIAKGTHIDFKARVQQDVTRSDALKSDAGEFETVDLGKRTLGVEGEIANAVAFEIERNLATEAE